MKILSKLSTVFAVIGAVFLGSAYIYPNGFEPFMVLGIGVLFVGLLLSFGARHAKKRTWQYQVFSSCSILSLEFYDFQE